MSLRISFLILALLCGGFSLYGQEVHQWEAPLPLWLGLLGGLLWAGLWWPRYRLKGGWPAWAAMAWQVQKYTAATLGLGQLWNYLTLLERAPDAMTVGPLLHSSLLLLLYLGLIRIGILRF